ncbi:MAG: DUF167 family protein [archaeon]
MIAIKGLEKNLAETRQGVLLPVQVVPQGKQFAVIGFDEWLGALKIRLRAKAEKGKANQELVEELRKIFSAEVEIAAGEKSQRKKLLVHAPKAHVLKILSGL